MVLLKFLLLLFVVAVFVILFIVLSFIRKVRDVTNMFSGRAGQGIAGNGRPHARQGQTEADKVIDRRSSSEANQKIFSKEEGEYVEFEEE